MSNPAATTDVYRTARLVRREQRHRRTVLLSIGILILLSTSPVFGHHLASKASVALAGRDHVFNLCLIALHALFAPVHGVFHVLLGAGLTYAIGSRLRATIRSGRTLSALEAATPVANESPFALASVRAGVNLQSVRVIHGLPVPAFTAGWLRPRIFITADLARQLTSDELTAVIAHEGAHAARRDPLRLSLLRFLADTLFYIPALRRLADDMSDEAEIAADDIAASGATTSVVLASAIIRLAEWADQHSTNSDAMPTGVVGFYRASLLERRVRRLIGEDSPVNTHVTRRSLAGAAAVLTLVWVSGLIMAHPLSAASGSPEHVGSGARQHSAVPEHCRHISGWSVGHIFCLGFGHVADGAHCPHTGM